MGFMATILGRRGALYREYPLPVALILDERRHVHSTLRLWGIVFSANVLTWARLRHHCAPTEGLEPQVLAALAQSGVKAASLTPPATSSGAA